MLTIYSINGEVELLTDAETPHLTNGRGQLLHSVSWLGEYDMDTGDLKLNKAGVVRAAAIAARIQEIDAQRMDNEIDALIAAHEDEEARRAAQSVRDTDPEI